jgi:hypothetical protein
MRKVLAIATLLAGLGEVGTSTLAAQECRMIELSAPRSLGRGESVEIQIATAPLPPGSRVVVMTEQGDVLGVVTAFGLPGATGNATVPVPRAAMAEGRLRLRLQLVEPGAPPRAPRADEVALSLVVSPRE